MIPRSFSGTCRHGQAADIAWHGFTADPSLSTYERLHEFAAAAGDWPERR